MFSWSNELCRDRRGNVTVEFAAFLPFLLLLLVGGLEIGNAIRHGALIEKNLRAGTLYAARILNPDADAPALSAKARATIQNLVRTGGQSGLDQPVVPGWADAAASLVIDASLVHVFSAENATAIDVAVPVVRLTAAVPYKPLLPGLLAFVKLNDIVIRLSHEQAYVGI
jgi:Flp pilus assembly protein TadG